MVSLVGQAFNFESGEVKLEKLIKTTSTEQIYLTSDNSIIKYIPLYTSFSKELYQNETTALRLLLDYPNIIELKDFLVIQGSSPVGLIKLEYCEKESLLSLAEQHIFTEIQVLHVAKDLLTAVSKLEEAGLVHKNISLRNILVTDAFNFILSGFGTSSLIQDLKGVDSKFLIGNIEKSVHPLKRTPELHSNLNLEKIDIYSVGCVIYSLVFHCYPSTQSEMNLGSIQIPLISQLLNSCLQKDPDLRPTAASLLFNLNPFPNFILSQSCIKLSFPSSGIVHSCLTILDCSENPPDLYYLQILTSKS